VKTVEPYLRLWMRWCYLVALSVLSQIASLRKVVSGGQTGADRAALDVCRRHGISTATFYNWKAKYGGLDVSEAKRLRALEDENARLKKLLADAMLDQAMLKELLGKKMVRPVDKRASVARLQSEFSVSQRRACRVIGADRTSMRYRTRRAPDTALRQPWRTRAAASAIAGCSSCCDARASRPAATASTGSTARRGWR